MAYRGGIPLEDIEVDFEVEPVERAGSIGFGVREVVTLKGNISEGERVRLQRASRYCPVGQALTKGSMVIEDEVQWRSGEITAISSSLGNLPNLEGALPVIQPGTVHGSYLLDTKEYDDEGVMQHEGEAKVYVETNNLTHTSRWTLMAGHSSPRLDSSSLPFCPGRLGGVYGHYLEPPAAPARRPGPPGYPGRSGREHLGRP